MTKSKAMNIAGWVLSGLIALLLIFSAWMKLSGAKEVVEGFTKMGLQDKAILIGVGELVSTILFLIPITHPMGVLLLSSYMGGAILANMSSGQSYVFPSVFLVLIWVAGFLRRPWLLVDPKTTKDLV